MVMDAFYLKETHRSQGRESVRQTEVVSLSSFQRGREWLQLPWRLQAPSSTASGGITIDLVGGILRTESSSFLESPFLSSSRAPNRKRPQVRYPEGTLSISVSLSLSFYRDISASL